MQEFGADCGQRLPEIAPRLGLEIVQIEADKYDGALLRIQGAHVGTIVINSRIREAGRRKFTLAHEIGHYLLPNQQDLVEPCSADSIETGAYLRARESESEANSFAAEVLMPREQMVDELRMTPCFQAVRSIAAKFGVSLTAAICRLVEFSTFRGLPAL